MNLGGTGISPRTKVPPGSFSFRSSFRFRSRYSSSYTTSGDIFHCSGSRQLNHSSYIMLQNQISITYNFQTNKECVTYKSCLSLYQTILYRTAIIASDHSPSSALCPTPQLTQIRHRNDSLYRHFLSAAAALTFLVRASPKHAHRLGIMIKLSFFCLTQPTSHTCTFDTSRAG